MLNREMMMPGIRMFPINVQVKSYWGDAWFLGAYVNQTISVGNDIKITRFYTHIEVSSAAQGTGTYTVILSTKPVKICEYENPRKSINSVDSKRNGILFRTCRRPNSLYQRYCRENFKVLGIPALAINPPSLLLHSGGLNNAGERIADEKRTDTPSGNKSLRNRREQIGHTQRIARILYAQTLKVRKHKTGKRADLRNWFGVLRRIEEDGSVRNVKRQRGIRREILRSNLLRRKRIVSRCSFKTEWGLFIRNSYFKGKALRSEWVLYDKNLLIPANASSFEEVRYA